MVLELCRRRIGQLHGATCPLPAGIAAPPLAERKAEELSAWWRSDAYGETERACLRFAEQFAARRPRALRRAPHRAARAPQPCAAGRAHRAASAVHGRFEDRGRAGWAARRDSRARAADARSAAAGVSDALSAGKSPLSAACRIRMRRSSWMPGCVCCTEGPESTTSSDSTPSMCALSYRTTPSPPPVYGGSLAPRTAMIELAVTPGAIGSSESVRRNRLRDDMLSRLVGGRWSGTRNAPSFPSAAISTTSLLMRTGILTRREIQ